MRSEAIEKEIERIYSAGGRVSFWYNTETGVFRFQVYGRSGMQAACVDIVDGVVVDRQFACKVTDSMREVILGAAKIYASDFTASYSL